MKSYSVYFANYTIGEDAYDQVRQVCPAYGKRVLLIGGSKALEAAEELLRDAVKDCELEIVDTVHFGSDCTYAAIDRWAAHAGECKADMIFGMGGGKALDTAMAAVYKEDGNFDSFYFFDKPARHCFINTRVIADAPYQYLRAGMGDTMGKFFECHFAARGDQLDHSSALGREISNLCYAPLLDHGVQALKDCMEHKASYDLQQAVLANIVSTGMVSLMVLDDYNCAVAHSVYYGLVLLPGFEEKYLHGDVVAYGVLVQLAVDKDMERLAEAKKFLKELGIPSTLREMEVPLDREALSEVLRETVTGPDMDHIPYPVTEDMVFEAMKVVEGLE